MTINRSALRRITSYVSLVLLCVLFPFLGTLDMREHSRIVVGVACSREDLTSISPGVEHLTVRFSPEDFYLLSEYKNVRYLSVAYSKGLTYESMRFIAELPRIESLDLSFISGFSVEIFGALARSESLREITLWGAQGLNDQTLRYLARIKNLQGLNLMETSRCSSEGIDALSEVPLEYLTLRGCSWVNGDVVQSVNKIRSLKEVDLTRCKVFGDADNSHLQQLLRLQELHAASSALDDKDCEWLALMPALIKLDITRTRVTDLGLLKLSGSKSLRLLITTASNVSANGIREFRSRNAFVRIVG